MFPKNPVPPAGSLTSKKPAASSWNLDLITRRGLLARFRQPLFPASSRPSPDLSSRITIRCVYLVTVLLFTGCASTVPPVTQQMAAVYSPAKYSAAQWPRIVADMMERAKLSTAEHDAVLAYVLAARQVPAAAQRSGVWPVTFTTPLDRGGCA